MNQNEHDTQKDEFIDLRTLRRDLDNWNEWEREERRQFMLALYHIPAGYLIDAMESIIEKAAIAEKVEREPAMKALNAYISTLRVALVDYLTEIDEQEAIEEAALLAEANKLN